MLQDVHKDTERQMKKVIESLKRDFAGIRTGRASVGLLDGITVDYYGTPTPLNQMATLSVPESSLIVIQPWDVSVIKHVEKALLRSDLGITPSNDGKVIRLAVPALTEERRKELAKLVRKRAEEKKVALRQARREANDMLKTLEKEKEITEDDLHHGHDQVQKLTDHYVKMVDELSEKKEAEILEI
ncbi:ribosome recycling factor [candidate division KSB3 bacterium]|uniref:Ribosome-recycling factor n=1 Tax=candidate division KSB3 bacterium TaxID=2044937 RepID=A0A2G6E4K1_9BACT|nr:MAG: ribosome recycling factor [candidate division KSB3 bacterium]PIE29434.1 MAG: ribosome recycling factor [candidate division KSB3 bacterium]